MKSLIVEGERVLWAVNTPPLWLVVVVEVTLFALGAWPLVLLPLPWVIVIACAIPFLLVQTVRIAIDDGRVSVLYMAGFVPHRWRRFGTDVTIVAEDAEDDWPGEPPDVPSVRIGRDDFMCAVPERVVAWAEKRRVKPPERSR